MSLPSLSFSTCFHTYPPINDNATHIAMNMIITVNRVVKQTKTVTKVFCCKKNWLCDQDTSEKIALGLHNQSGSGDGGCIDGID